MNQINFDDMMAKEIVKKTANELCQELIKTNSISLLTIYLKENGEFGIMTHKYLSSKDLDDCLDIIIKNRI